MKQNRSLALIAAGAALCGVVAVGPATGVAAAAPPGAGAMATDKPWRGHDHWRDDWRDGRDGRWDGGRGCVSVTGPYGHVTITSCR